MSVEIFSGTLAVKENVGGNFQRHFSCDRKKCRWKFPATFWLREKCLWKFPAPDISTVPINVGEVSSEEKWRWKFPATFWL